MRKLHLPATSIGYPISSVGYPVLKWMNTSVHFLITFLVPFLLQFHRHLHSLVYFFWFILPPFLPNLLHCLPASSHLFTLSFPFPPTLLLITQHCFSMHECKEERKITEEMKQKSYWPLCSKGDWTPSLPHSEMRVDQTMQGCSYEGGHRCCTTLHIHCRSGIPYVLWLAILALQQASGNVICTSNIW